VLLLRGPGAGLDGGASALIVADPARPDQDSLRAAHTEAATVRSSFPGARVLAGADATADAVTRAMPGSRILHFACHGVAVVDDPMRSALLLAGDGELRLAQLAATPMDGVDLAVLAACRTAASDIALPGEALNLAAGLLAAGTRTVIGSLWPVPDAATAALMAVFYARLAAGRPPADALREAQLAFTDGTVRTPPEAGGDEWSEPYFWAGFVCLGR
jgi:CHAT domain-containing protein